MSTFGFSKLPTPANEPLRDYAPGSEDAEKLAAALEEMLNECPEICPIVNGEEVKTESQKQQTMPTRKNHVLCTYYEADKDLVNKAVEGAMEAKKEWEAMSPTDRFAIFTKAADLLAGPYRYKVMAATMLGQGKNVWQAEIDAACETIDFLRFNPWYAEQIYGEQPPLNSKGVWNQLEYRPLEGYVVAIAPFNFTAIGANLPASPAIMGNVVLWKPASTAILSNYLMYKIFEEAGLPAGVMQFLPGRGSMMGEILFNHEEFSGLHFTGSTAVFNGIWQQTAQNLDIYKSYPRIVGETGGKNMHFIHESASLENVVYQTVRGAFEYQGQKCSATSRVYVPDTIAEQFQTRLVEEINKIKVGDVTEFDSFVCAVIDANAFKDITGYIDWAKEDESSEIIVGGTYDDTDGYFIQPTVIVTTNPKSKTMSEEIFGPVLTMYVYPADEYEETMKLADSTSQYALTGSLFAKDRKAVATGRKILQNSMGNFYINDKSTGAVVGQQPFGGARGSGTNDKAGHHINLLRWTSLRTIKENFTELTGFGYPHMG
eukprot:TRINITY_DN6048_c0_g1_i1.p1 TRINITY_DN6048_c0_g1~~TRINITY_DN6048_c0_g1_i1.p1  ORF type:complete len:555 (+),score=210.88 TRINITY_DN6048_c0_g1_i1:34-1665(+)